MTKTINMRLSSKDIKKAIKELERYKKDLRKKTKLLVARLADEGINTISATMQGIPSSFEPGDDWEVKSKVDSKGNLVSATVTLSGSKILFIEFGAGIRYASNTNPKAGEFGYGAGTYPGKGHWDDPNGWWYKDETTGERVHSYGNPALSPMYWGTVAIEQQIIKIAKEVFK